MPVLRIPASKSNTIASGAAYEWINSGLNPVMNLWYGGGQTTSLYTRNSISRYLVQFNLSDLTAKFADKTIMSGNVTSYKLKIKNSLPSDVALTSEFEFDRLVKKVASSYDLIFFPINKSWDQGRCYDLVSEIYIQSKRGNVRTSGYSNWISATQATAWDAPGVFANPTASTSLYATQRFDLGDEDIDVDVTNIVNDWVSGGSTNNGFGIAFRRDYEILTSNTRYISAFFTEKTNTAFEPSLEVTYDQTIRDERAQVSNDRLVRLFLLTYSGNQPTNYFSASTVVIENIDGTNFNSGITPTQLQKGVYYIDILMSSATVGERYMDTWSGITFVAGRDQQNMVQYFDIKKSFYTSNSKSVNEYAVDIWGIDNNSVISDNDVFRVYVRARTNYTSAPAYVPYGLQYRMVMNNLNEIMTWSDASYTIIDGCLTYFFDVDTSWLQTNQTYKLLFKINELGTSRILSDQIDFRIIKTLEMP